MDSEIDCVCVYRALFFLYCDSKSTGFHSSGINWNPLYFYVVEEKKQNSSGFQTPLEYGRFQWSPLESA
jgi:hypothetical protein